MPIRYKIVKDLQLMYTLFSGKVDVYDAFEYAKNIYKNPEIDNASSTLVFLKDSQLKYSVEDVEEFSKKIINGRKFNKRRKIAILISNPIDTVAATIFAQTILSNRKGIEVELFYTLEAALDFMDLTDKKDQIDEIIHEYSLIADCK
jgi:hypothetical protein